MITGLTVTVEQYLHSLFVKYVNMFCSNVNVKQWTQIVWWTTSCIRMLFSFMSKHTQYMSLANVKYLQNAVICCFGRTSFYGAFLPNNDHTAVQDKNQSENFINPHRFKIWIHTLWMQKMSGGCSTKFVILQSSHDATSMIENVKVLQNLHAYLIF